MTGKRWPWRRKKKSASQQAPKPDAAPDAPKPEAAAHAPSQPRQRVLKQRPFREKLAAVAGVLGVGAMLFYFVALPGGQRSAPKRRVPAPDFTMADVHGKPRKLSDFRGKVVLLDFWATWCEPCQEEIPDLVRFHDAHKDQGFTIVGVAMDAEGTSVVGPFVRQNKIPYPILISGGDLPPGYNVIGFPSAFLIDKDGNIARRYLGPKSYEELERDVAELGAGR